MSPTQTWFGAVETGWPSKRLGAARTVGLESVVRGTNERGCWVEPECPQARRSQRPPDAPTAHPAAFGVQFGPQAAGTIAGSMPPKLRTYRDLLGWLGSK